MKVLISRGPNAGFRLACRSPLCRVIIACCFRVAALSGNAASTLSPSGIAPKLNRIQLSAICRGRQSGKVIDQLNWLDPACRLVIPLRQVALAQLYKYHHQSGNAASGKLVWKQHKSVLNTDSFILIMSVKMAIFCLLLILLSLPKTFGLTEFCECVFTADRRVRVLFTNL